MQANTTSINFEKKPLCVLVIGMAGSGKSSFVKALSEYLHEFDKQPYTINLDPAVYSLPYSPNIDIRDSINYKDVMKNYNLGPNGAILTSLNLFSTEMKDVVGLIDKNSSLTNNVIVDNPGQIEMFKWSASGKIITQCLASSFPTVIVYVLDCSRCTNPVTFMSNMLYASGVAIEYELPFIVAMNKVDIIDCSYLDKWMNDISTFLEDMDEHDLGYMTSLTRQTSMALDIFYSDLKRCGVSSFTGSGFKELHNLLQSARDEFFNVYLKEVLPERLNSQVNLSDSVFIGNLGEVDEEIENEEVDNNLADDTIMD